MEANPKIEEKLREIQSVEEALGVLHSELGALVAAEMTVVVRPPGKMLVSGPAPAAVAPTVANVLDAAHGSAAAGAVERPTTRPTADGEVESLPKRLERLLTTNPTRTFTADEAAESLGEKARKTHYTLLRRMARKGLIAKVGRGKFRARRTTNGKH